MDFDHVTQIHENKRFGIRKWQREVYTSFIGMSSVFILLYVFYSNYLGLILSAYTFVQALWARIDDRSSSYCLNAIVQLMNTVIILIALKTQSGSLQTFVDSREKEYVCIAYVIVGVAFSLLSLSMSMLDSVYFNTRFLTRLSAPHPSKKNAASKKETVSTSTNTTTDELSHQPQAAVQVVVDAPLPLDLSEGADPSVLICASVISTTCLVGEKGAVDSSSYITEVLKRENELNDSTETVDTLSCELVEGRGEVESHGMHCGASAV